MKIFSVLALIVFVGFSLIFPSHAGAAAVCNISPNVNNITGSVIIQGSVSENFPGQDPSATYVMVSDNQSGGSAEGYGTEMANAQYTRTFPNGTYRAHIQGYSFSNPPGTPSSCISHADFTVNVPGPPPPPPNPTADIKANGSDGPINISYNTAATISWSSTNATSCSVSPSGWSGTSGSQSSGNLTASRTYTLNCTGPGGSAQDWVQVNVNPQGGGGPPPGAATCSPGSQNVLTGQTVTLTGQQNGGGAITNWAAPGSSNPSTSGGNSWSGTYSTAGLKTITVTNGAGSNTCTVNVTAPGVPPPGTFSFSAPSCSNTPYSVTINWPNFNPHPTAGPSPGYYADVSRVNSFNPFYNKFVPAGTTSTQAPTGFSCLPGGPPGGNWCETTPPWSIAGGLTPGITHYVRVFTNEGHQPSSTGHAFNVPVCAAPPTLQVPTTPSCSTGDYTVNLNWSGVPDPTHGFFTDVTTVPSFATHWNKKVTGSTFTTPALTGFSCTSTNFCPGAPPAETMVLQTNKTYYARIYGAGGHSNTVSWNVPACAPPTSNLTVNSSGAAGVAITSNTAGMGGTTNYTRTGIPTTTTIVLTAPATSGVAAFSSWTCTGGTANNTARTCTIPMTANRTVTVNYAVANHTLTVNSAGASGVAVTRVSGPADIGGTTNYTRSVPNGTSFVLRAPATSGTNNFANWVGCTSVGGTGNQDCTVTNMTAARTLTATFSPPPAPTIVSTTINPKPVNTNGTTQHTITVIGSANGGGSTINRQYALINYQGTNAGQYRGYITWDSSTGWPTAKGHRACTGGGHAAIQSVSPNDIYGHAYVELDSCSTSISGNNRTVNFVVRFNTNFTTPANNNTLSGLAQVGATSSGWQIGETFSIVSSVAPTIISADISPKPVTPNGTTQHTITVIAGHAGPGGGSAIDRQYAIINYQGANAGQHRGYITWINNASGWPTAKGNRACTGGGYAAIQSQPPSHDIYGHEYIELDSCTTSVSGNNRTVTFTVRFNTNFTAPLANNRISGLSYTPSTNSGWQQGGVFDLASAIVPTITGADISPKPVNSNGTSQYTITVVSNYTGTGGGSGIGRQYAIVNHQGANAGQHRGYLTWHSGGGWPALKGHNTCTGGGHAAIQPNYGAEYIELSSCSTSVSGNSRTVNFVVRFNTNFTAPLANNMVSGLTYVGSDTTGPTSNWVQGGTFNLAVATPFNYSLTPSDPTVSVTAGSATVYVPNTITKAVVAGTPESVTLDATALPSGVTLQGGISGNGCVLGPSCSSSVVTLAISPSAQSGNVVITGTSASGVVRTAQFSLNVSAPPISVACAPSTANGIIGQNIMWTAAPNGGTPPFSYEWSGTGIPAGASGNPYTISYSTIGIKNAFVRITDSAGETDEAQCEHTSGNPLRITVTPSVEEF